MTTTTEATASDSSAEYWTATTTEATDTEAPDATETDATEATKATEAPATEAPDAEEEGLTAEELAEWRALKLEIAAEEAEAKAKADAKPAPDPKILKSVEFTKVDNRSELYEVTLKESGATLGYIQMGMGWKAFPGEDEPKYYTEEGAAYLGKGAKIRAVEFLISAAKAKAAKSA